MKRLKLSIRSLLILLLLLLGGCASKSIRIVNETDFISTLASGELVQDGDCSGTWGWNRNQMRALYTLERWEELARMVHSIGCSQDMAYYYLGRSAEGLGFYDAAKKYYKSSILSSKVDSHQHSCGYSSLFNNCDGSYPADARNALSNLNKKIKSVNVSSTFHGKAMAVGVKSSAAQERNFKDDLPRLLSALPQIAKDSNKYLFVISIDDYDEAPNVTFAGRSAQLFVDTMQRLGVPEENTTFLSNSQATGTRIVSRLNRMLHRIGPKDTLYFYYAGHGLPSRKTKHTYLLPVDGDMGSYEDSNLAMGTLYKLMSEPKAKHVNAFVDACFSGRADQETMVFKGVAGILVKPRVQIDKTRMTLFTAGQGSQFANEYETKGHRLFSYHLIKGLLEGKSDLRKLGAYVQKNVAHDSRKLGPTYMQEPQIYGSVNHEF
jgi:hypothetical protein